MAFLERDGVRLYAERQGVGPPLLYINGTGQALAVRPNGFDLPLAASFDMTCFDQRGLGHSEQPKPGVAWTMADYGDDAAAVLDWAGWETANVIGVSFGGMVAQELMIRHPGRIARAVLACTSSGGAGGSSFPLHTLAVAPTEERVATYLEIMDTRWSDPASDDPMRAYFLTMMQSPPAPTDGATAQLAARSGHDTWSRLPEIDAKVLICAGRYDGLAPLANSEAMARQIPDAQLAVFDGGHGFMFQVPAAVDVMHDFLLAVG